MFDGKTHGFRLRFPSLTRRTYTPPRCRLHGGHGHAVSHMFCQAPAAAAATGSDQGIARHLIGRGFLEGLPQPAQHVGSC